MKYKKEHESTLLLKNFQNHCTEYGYESAIHFLVKNTSRLLKLFPSSTDAIGLIKSLLYPKVHPRVDVENAADCVKNLLSLCDIDRQFYLTHFEIPLSDQPGKKNKKFTNDYIFWLHAIVKTHLLDISSRLRQEQKAITVTAFWKEAKVHHEKGLSTQRLGAISEVNETGEEDKINSPR